MITHDLALAVHLFGVIVWIGGTVVAAAVAAASLGAGEAGKVGLAAAGRALRWWSTPGLVLAWLGGLSILVPDFTTVYAHAGWMHAKLTLLLVASAITGILTARLRKAAAGTKPATSGLMNGLGIGIAAIAFAVVILAVLKPF